MPIYEYRCDNCGHELETIQKISENPLKTCPNCNQDALVKKVSAAGFRLKGGGWYETDFKKKGDKKLHLVFLQAKKASIKIHIWATINMTPTPKRSVFPAS